MALDFDVDYKPHTGYNQAWAREDGDTNKQTLYAMLEDMAAKAMSQLREAEEFAKQHKLAFSFRPAYAMGGTYEGDPEEYAARKEYNYNVHQSTDTGWAPSTGSC